MIQPAELSDGERRRFLTERLARCTLQDHRRSAARSRALTELVRKLRDRTQRPMPPPFAQARGDTSDPVPLITREGHARRHPAARAGRTQSRCSQRRRADPSAHARATMRRCRRLRRRARRRGEVPAPRARTVTSCRGARAPRPWSRRPIAELDDVRVVNEFDEPPDIARTVRPARPRRVAERHRADADADRRRHRTKRRRSTRATCAAGKLGADPDRRAVAQGRGADDRCAAAAARSRRRRAVVSAAIARSCVARSARSRR